jgi:hypothetical protein
MRIPLCNISPICGLAGVREEVVVLAFYFTEGPQLSAAVSNSTHAGLFSVFHSDLAFKIRSALFCELFFR